jgi:hypothetical protein
MLIECTANYAEAGLSFSRQILTRIGSVIRNRCKARIAAFDFALKDSVQLACKSAQ